MKKKLNNWIDQPVLVTEQMKSGGTFFHTMLDGHPEIINYPEPPAFIRFLNDSKQKNDLLKHYFTRLRNHANNTLHINNFDKTTANFDIKKLKFKGEIRGVDPKLYDLEKYYNKLIQKIENKKAISTKDILRYVIESFYSCSDQLGSTPKYWMFRENITSNKTLLNQNRSSPQNIKDLLQLFPSLKCLYIIRDPRGILVSRRDHNSKGKGKKWKRFIGLYNFMNDVYIIKHSILLSLEIKNSLKSNLHFVKYEDLIEDPIDTQNSICDFLDIPYNDKMYTPSFLGMPRKVITSFGKFKSDQVNKSRKNRWKNELNFVQKAICEAFFTDQNKIFKKFDYSFQTNYITRILLKLIVVNPVITIGKIISLIRSNT